MPIMHSIHCRIRACFIACRRNLTFLSFFCRYSTFAIILQVSSSAKGTLYLWQLTMQALSLIGFFLFFFLEFCFLFFLPSQTLLVAHQPPASTTVLSTTVSFSFVYQLLALIIRFRQPSSCLCCRGGTGWKNANQAVSSSEPDAKHSHCSSSRQVLFFLSSHST